MVFRIMHRDIKKYSTYNIGVELYSVVIVAYGL